MNTGIAIEAEELGMVALVGCILLPGVMWAANGKTASSKVFRSLAVLTFIGAAAALEISLDRTANNATNLLDGDAR